MHEQPTPEKILQTGLAFWASKTLLSAIEMGVFSELARGPEPFESVKGRIGLHPRAARDFLDALVARSPRTWAASSRWRIIACTRSGDT
jgi:hypothetical protein